MSIQTWLYEATQQLSAAGIVTARLDALVLLEDCLNKNRTHFLAHGDDRISPEQQKILSEELRSRANHTPLAYIRGKAEFYGREFIVTKDVLVPRPESETMLDLLLNAPKLPHQTRIADLGTGSGALGITVKMELPTASCDLIDISSKALAVAKMNVIKFATRQTLIRSNLLLNTPANYQLLLCNLPYVPDDMTINAAARHEPPLALFGGSDGLNLYRTMFSQIEKTKNIPLLILCESFPSQHDSLQAIAEQSGYKLTKTDDFIQLFSNAA